MSSAAEASFLDKACAGLPPALLSVLPVEEHEQLEVAHRITCHAFAHKVSKLETETEQLQSDLMHSQQTVKALERRLAGMETELVEQQQRARHAMSEQHKLVAEKNALIETVKRLNREVAKLEHFKRNLLQQLQDDCDGEAAGSAYAAVDMTTERLVSEVLHSADGIAAAAAAAAGAAAAPGTSGSHYQHQQQQRHHQHHQQQQMGGGGGGYQQRHSNGQGSWSPQGQRGGGGGGGAGRLQGSGSPGTNMYAGGSGGAGYTTHTAAAADSSSAAGGGGGGGAGGGGSSSSPYRSSVRPSASASAAKEGTALGSRSGIPAASSAAAAAGVQLGAAARNDSSGNGSARGLAAAANMVGPRFSSPPHAGGGGGGSGRGAGGGGGGGGGRAGAATSPRIDGKEFFRQARARLSYEQFSQFLVAIKDLNAGRTSREDTLGAAKALFGPSNGDLYGLFEGLLLRHLTNF